MTRIFYWLMRLIPSSQSGYVDMVSSWKIGTNVTTDDHEIAKNNYRDGSSVFHLDRLPDAG